MPEEVPLGEDVKDWAANLNDPERALLTQIFRFFTQSDVEVNDNYMERYSHVFRPTEIKMMLASFSNMETIHIAAYALLLETDRHAELEFSAFTQYKGDEAGAPILMSRPGRRRWSISEDGIIVSGRAERSRSLSFTSVRACVKRR